MIDGSDYTLKTEKCYNFQYQSQSVVYLNTNHYNTFIFNGVNEEIVLYYQPVIWGHQYNANYNNGIKLVRSTSFGSDGRQSMRNAQWTPDYMIKLIRAGKEKYIILDAKYTDRRTFLRERMKDLVYKYMFAIQTLDNAEFLGGCYLYGKNYYTECRMVNIHDIYPIDSDGRMFWIVSLCEGRSNDTQQMNELRKIIDVLKQ